jgi:hypothetical protein
MVEEPDSRGDFGLPLAIDIQLHLDGSFLGFPGHRSFSISHVFNLALFSIDKCRVSESL